MFHLKFVSTDIFRLLSGNKYNSSRIDDLLILTWNLWLEGGVVLCPLQSTKQPEIIFYLFNLYLYFLLFISFNSFLIQSCAQHNVLMCCALFKAQNNLKFSHIWHILHVCSFSFFIFFAFCSCLFVLLHNFNFCLLFFILFSICTIHIDFYFYLLHLYLQVRFCHHARFLVWKI